MLTFTLIARTHMPRIAEPRRKSMTVLRSRSTTTKTNFETRTNENAKAQTNISQALFSPYGSQDQLENDISTFCNFHITLCGASFYRRALIAM